MTAALGITGGLDVATAFSCAPAHRLAFQAKYILLEARLDSGVLSMTRPAVKAIPDSESMAARDLDRVVAMAPSH